MKIAILSDIHGNYIALESILKHAEKIGVNYYFVLGDLVGYYHQVKNVIEKIRSLDGVVIQGNHERLLMKVINQELLIEELTRKYGEGHQTALQCIKKNDLEWLNNLPIEQDIIIDNIAIKLCHGAPGKPDLYLYPNSERNILLQYCNNNYDFIFMGHSHYPFVFRNDRCSLVNVGSVGQSKDIGGLATWGVLDTSNTTYIQYRTPYNVDELIQEIEISNNSNKKYLISVLKRNRFDK